MGLFGLGRKKKTIPKEVAEKPSFCMWKPTKEDPSFSTSKIIEFIDQLFEMVDGQELHAFNGIGIHTGKHLDSIPEKETYIHMRKNGVDVLVSLSKAKGLRFRFDYDNNSPMQIVATLFMMIKLFASSGFAENRKLHSVTEGKKWWSSVKAIVAKQPEKDVETIGLLA